MNGVDPAVNMVNCEGWVDVTKGHAACEITDYATEITNYYTSIYPS